MKSYSCILFIICATSNCFNAFYTDRIKEFQLLTNNVYSEELVNIKSFADLVTDIVLKELSQYLKDNNETTIEIPEIDTSYGAIDLKTSTGIFTNPITIERHGESDFKRVDSAIILSFSVGFRLMDVYFNRYTVSMADLVQESGSVNIKIGKNSLFLEITVNFNPHCTISLTNVYMKDFDDIDVDIDGLSILDYLADQIVSWILESYKSSFSDIIEVVIKNKLQQELTHTSLCKYKLKLKQAI